MPCKPFSLGNISLHGVQLIHWRRLHWADGVFWLAITIVSSVFLGFFLFLLLGAALSPERPESKLTMMRLEPGPTAFPAVSLCNLNPYKTSEMSKQPILAALEAYFESLLESVYRMSFEAPRPVYRNSCPAVFLPNGFVYYSVPTRLRLADEKYASADERARNETAALIDALEAGGGTEEPPEGQEPILVCKSDGNWTFPVNATFCRLDCPSLRVRAENDTGDNTTVLGGEEDVSDYAGIRCEDGAWRWPVNDSLIFSAVNARSLPCPPLSDPLLEAGEVTLARDSFVADAAVAENGTLLLLASVRHKCRNNSLKFANYDEAEVAFRCVLDVELDGLTLSATARWVDVSTCVAYCPLYVGPERLDLKRALVPPAGLLWYETPPTPGVTEMEAGSNVTFVCLNINRTRELLGNPVAICGDDGLWQFHVLRCLDSSACPEAERPVNVHVVGTGLSAQQLGGSFFYSCDKKEKPTERICLSNGTHGEWDSGAIKCCGEVEWAGELRGTGLVAYPDSRRVGKVARLSCASEGYILVGSANSLVCESNSDWNYRNGKRPSCVKISRATRVFLGRVERAMEDPVEGWDPISLRTRVDEVRSYVIGTLARSELVKLLHPPEELFAHCSFAGQKFAQIPCPLRARWPLWALWLELSVDLRCDLEKDLEAWHDPRLGVCYTFNRNSTYQVSNLGGIGTGLSVRLYINKTQYLTTTQTSGAVVFLSPNDGTVTSDAAGYYVSMGFHSSISIRQRESRKMGPPYSGCVGVNSTLESQLNFFYDTAYSTDGCFHTCRQTKIQRTCGCHDPRLPLPLPPFDVTETCAVSERDCVEEVWLNATLHQLKTTCNGGWGCPEPCVDTEYEAVVSQSSWPSHSWLALNRAGNCLDWMSDRACLQWARRNRATLDIYFQQLGIQVMEERPALTAVGIISSVGSQCSIWLGASAISLTELFLLIPHYAGRFLCAKR